MKDYDTTTARMAGNIAAGLVGRCNGTLTIVEAEERRVIVQSVRMAKAIVEELKANHPPVPGLPSSR